MSSKCICAACEASLSRAKDSIVVCENCESFYHLTCISVSDVDDNCTFYCNSCTQTSINSAKLRPTPRRSLCSRPPINSYPRTLLTTSDENQLKRTRSTPSPIDQQPAKHRCTNSSSSPRRSPFLLSGSSVDSQSDPTHTAHFSLSSPTTRTSVFYSTSQNIAMSVDGDANINLARNTEPLDRHAVDSAAVAPPEHMPAWFAQTNNLIMKISSDINNGFAHMNNRLSAIEERQRALEERQRNDNAAATQNQDLVDECEVRISNIPVSCKLAPYDIVMRVLTAIGCVNLQAQVIDARVWGKTTRVSGNAASVNASSAQGISANANRSVQSSQEHDVGRDSQSPLHRVPPPVPPRPNSAGLQNNYFSVVFQLASVNSRDRVMRNAPRLRNLSTNNILETSGKSDYLFINPIFPKRVYQIYRSALERYKIIGFLKPVVRNLTVFMRERRDSVLISRTSAS